MLVLSPDSVRIEGKAPVGRRFIDVGGVAEPDEIVVRDRQHISEEGVVLAVVAINKATGKVEGSAGTGKPGPRAGRRQRRIPCRGARHHHCSPGGVHQ